VNLLEMFSFVQEKDKHTYSTQNNIDNLHHGAFHGSICLESVTKNTILGQHNNSQVLLLQQFLVFFEIGA
jgi:hypothetical protein